jgi:hypothetical protein
MKFSYGNRQGCTDNNTLQIQEFDVFMGSTTADRLSSIEIVTWLIAITD